MATAAMAFPFGWAMRKGNNLSSRLYPEYRKQTHLQPAIYPSFAARGRYRRTRWTTVSQWKVWGKRSTGVADTGTKVP